MRNNLVTQKLNSETESFNVWPANKKFIRIEHLRIILLDEILATFDLLKVVSTAQCGGELCLWVCFRHANARKYLFSNR